MHLTGRIIVRETSQPLPDLIVVVYDTTGTPMPAVLAKHPIAPPDEFWAIVPGFRLGSVATDGLGQFDFKADPGVHGRAACEPDIAILIVSPENAGPAPCQQLLHVVCGVRKGAGPTEQVRIRIPKELLERAGIVIPKPPRVGLTPTQVLRQWDADDFRQAAKQQRREEFIRRVEGRKVREADKPKIQRPESFLSRIPQEVRESLFYVKTGEDAPQKNREVITNNIETTIGPGVPAVRRIKQKGQMIVTVGLNRLKDEGKFRANVTAETIVPLVTGLAGTAHIPADRVRIADPTYMCRDLLAPDEQCEKVLGEAPVAEKAAPAPAERGARAAAGADALIANEIPERVARLVGGIDPDNLGALEKIAQRATPDNVSTSVRTLQLKTGIADLPAYQEFHSLKIAFQDVWQEAFDQDLLELIRQAYAGIQEIGGDPAAVFDPAQLGGMMSMVENLQADDPPPEVAQSFEITVAEWQSLTEAQRHRLLEIAQSYAELFEPLHATNPAEAGMLWLAKTAGAELELDRLATARDRETAKRLLRYGRNIIRYGREKSQGGQSEYNHLHPVLSDLAARLKQGYSFTAYAADSVNFGALISYNQKWDPLGYQAGELVSTITLAARETRKYSKKVSQRKSSVIKQVEESSRNKRDEFAQTSRAEAEIVQRARNKTNFNVTVKGSFDLLLADGKVTTSLAHEDERSSEETKRNFREAVIKAAEEYKQDHKIDISTEEVATAETEESGEITNPNEEIPVTYLFYELQRRFRISERIHRIRPVVLVAQVVPGPEEITEAWVIANDWILKRVVLDDSFRPAMAYLSSGAVAADEFVLQELRKNVLQLRELVQELQEEVVGLKDTTGYRYAALERSIQQQASVAEEQDSEGFFEGVGDFFTGSSGESEEAARIRESAAQDAYERAAREQKELESRVEREVMALNTATEQYNKALQVHLSRQTEIDRLLVHIKENILYYMQAIWTYEQPDQRFLRLHHKKIPALTGSLTFNLVTGNLPPGFAHIPGAAAVNYTATCTPDLPLTTVTLEEAADLEQLLGFRGNYMIFPLKTSNILTDFMMLPYIDAFLGLKDPDDAGNWTQEDFAKYVCCLKKRLSADRFAEIRQTLRQQFLKILNSPRQASEEITIPTGSLFIEALPGTHAILEDFKLLHRAVDVKKAQADVRHAELENLRLAARVLAKEYEDPEIEKQIRIQGNVPLVIP